MSSRTSFPPYYVNTGTGWQWELKIVHHKDETLNIWQQNRSSPKIFQGGYCDLMPALLKFIPSGDPPKWKLHEMRLWGENKRKKTRNNEVTFPTTNFERHCSACVRKLEAVTGRFLENLMAKKIISSNISTVASCRHLTGQWSFVCSPRMLSPVNNTYATGN